MRAIELIRFFCFTNWKISSFLIYIGTLSIQKNPKKKRNPKPIVISLNKVSLSNSFICTGFTFHMGLWLKAQDKSKL